MLNEQVQKIKGMFSVKTRFTDVLSLVGQTLVVSALAPLYSRDPMILCVATAFSLLYQLLQLVIH